MHPAGAYVALPGCRVDNLPGSYKQVWTGAWELVSSQARPGQAIPLTATLWL